MSRTEDSSVSDAELIARAQGGQVEAFGELYDRYLDTIFRYIRSRVDDQSDAEDLCETVFMRSFEAIDGYEERGHPFSAYLYQVARNHLADHYRSSAAQAALELDPEAAADEGDPEVDYDEREQFRLAMIALDGLPNDYQEVIRLRVLMELPTDMVALWMDRSQGAVRVLLHRALLALRESMKEADGS